MPPICHHTSVTQRAAIYTRISRDREGAGLGVERQRDDCQELARRLGWSVVATHTDNDLSAYSGKPRPGYKALLEDIRAGRVDAVLAWHNDRLHRSPVELEQYIEVCGSVPTQFVKAGDLDLSTASGRMTARITGVVARHEVEHMSERIKAQKDKAAAAGDWLGGRRPFGYLNTEDGLQLVPEEAEAIRDGIRRVLAGESVYSVTRRWRARVPSARGGEWLPVNVARTLTRPRNAGLQVHRGEVVGRGSFPPIVSEDEYHAVCAILKDPKRNNYAGVRSLRWLGSGLYVCGRCGGDIRPGTAIERNGSRRRIYRCRATPHLKINAPPTDAYVMELVCGHLDAAGAALLPAVEGQQGLIDRLRDEAAALRVRYEQLDDMFSDGEITRAGRTKQRERIERKLAEINIELERHATTTPLSGIADADSPSAAFLDQPVARQRSIVDKLMTVTILPGRPGRLPGSHGVDFDRVKIDWRTVS